MSVWVGSLLTLLGIAAPIILAANYNMRDIAYNGIDPDVSQQEVVAIKREEASNLERNTDPNSHHSESAIIATDNSAVINLPMGNPPALAEDIPGAALSPSDFDYQLPVMEDGSPLESINDPIELAGAFEGDIILADIQELKQMTQPASGETMAAAINRNAVIQPDRVWPNNEIPYVISSSYNKHERGAIAVAMRNFHSETCIKFVPRTRHSDYIHIFKGDGCSSSVGRVGGNQAVSLGDGCLYVGIVMHELMHAAGFWHEQSRFDRDDYIRIYWSNIKNGMDYNFQKYDWKTISHLDMAYDLGSIMHYGPRSFAKDRNKKTIEAKNGAEIGQRRSLSNMDITKLKKLYKCDNRVNNKVTPKPVGPGGSSGGTQSRCEDIHDSNQCQAWALTNECKKNPAWMLSNCKKSCGSCEEKCKDFNENCAYWTTAQECTKNTAYMHVYCKLSCGLCHAQNPFIAGDSTDDCIDQNQYCEDWAASGTCHTNTEYMLVYCKKSCTTCKPINKY